MNSLTFLEEIYPDKPDDAYILLWKNKKSKWFKDIDKAAAHINNDGNDLYYGVGLSPKNYGTNKRCKADNILGIPGLYADIDIGTGSKKYPPTIDDAMSLLKNNQYIPTMIVDSGYGLHAYWLFKEFWEFKNDADRNYAANLSKRINNSIKLSAQNKGWDVDNVSDLARVLRPVGSYNCKKDPKLVSIILNTGPKYPDADHFDQILPIIEEYSIQPQPKLSDKELSRLAKLFTLKATAEPPQEKLDFLLENDPDFKMLWQRHKSLKKDKTPSGFHMSMANVVARVEWSDQEMVDLMIAWNRRHEITLEKVLNRPDYFVKTIAKARQDASTYLSEEYSMELTNISGTKYEQATMESNKKKALEILSHNLGFKILGITKFIQEKKPRYVMYTEKGDITFVGPEELDMKSKFQQRILAATNIALSLTARKFEAVKGAYRHIIVDVIVSKESTVQSRMNAWLTEYLDGKPRLDQHEAVVGNKPFIHDGKWHIYSTSFKEWAFRNRHDREEISKTEFDLKIIGAEHKRFNPIDPKNDTKRITKRPWEIPITIIKP